MKETNWQKNLEEPKAQSNLDIYEMVEYFVIVEG